MTLVNRVKKSTFQIIEKITLPFYSVNMSLATNLTKLESTIYSQLKSIKALKRMKRYKCELRQ